MITRTRRYTYHEERRGMNQKGPKAWKKEGNICKIMSMTRIMNEHGFTLL